MNDIHDKLLYKINSLYERIEDNEAKNGLNKHIIVRRTISENAVLTNELMLKASTELPYKLDIHHNWRCNICGNIMHERRENDYSSWQCEYCKKHGIINILNEQAVIEAYKKYKTREEF